MDLPKFVVLKSNYNHKYMRYINEEVKVRGLLQFTGEEVVSPYVKFKVEMAESGDGRRVHIRWCYNNKYLARWSPRDWWIAAGAKEPEEDQSKWSCTLFEPISADDGDDDAKTVRFRHVQLNHYACLWRADAPYTSCLYAGSKENDRDGCDVFTIIDWESVSGYGGGSEESCRCFSLSEIRKATNDFDDALVLGIGGFGKVYKGFIDDGATTVAIKRLNVESSQGAKEFWTEIKMLSKLRHTYLVALIGYCNSNKEMLLVYEYIISMKQAKKEVVRVFTSHVGAKAQNLHWCRTRIRPPSCWYRSKFHTPRCEDPKHFVG